VDDANSFSIDFTDRFGFLRSNEKLIDPPLIRVYLAGPLTNNASELSVECAQIRAAIKLALADYEFLGVRFEVYDPAEVTAPRSAHTAQEVYATDHRCTVCADLVVFLVNTPSLGVGIESQLTAAATTPRIVVKKQSVPISRMFEGMFCSTIAEISYASAGEVYDQLSRLLPEICPQVIESIERRRPHIASILDQNLGRLFLRQRIRHGVKLVDVAKQTDIQEWWLEQLERCPEFSSTLSLAQIHRISDSLFCNANLRERRIEIVDSSGSLRADENDSLSNLVDFVTGRPKVNEGRVFAIWREYSDEQLRQAQEGTAARGLHDGAIVVSAEEWRKRYDDSLLF
jgi:hypothetical protein